MTFGGPISLARSDGPLAGRLLVLALGVLLSGCGAGEPGTGEGAGPVDEAPTKAAPSTATGVKLLVTPFADFYFLVRAQAAGVVEAEPELQPIVDAWLPVQDEIGTFGGFWRFDLAGLESENPQEFAEWFADSPDEVPSRAGGSIPIKSAGLAMAAAMEEVWPRFLGERWPDRRARLEEVLGRLEREFLPKQNEAFAFMLDSLGIEDPGIDVPTHLVLEAHPPGASTYRSRSGPVLVLSTNDLLGEGRFSDLEETILHEACHALDLSSDGDQDVFSVLRRMLEERGVGPEDRRLRDVPHLVMFVQAENTMRRLYDPGHVAYGDTRRGEIAPLYERSGEAADVVRSAWSEFLDGDLSREQALARIVEELVDAAP